MVIGVLSDIHGNSNALRAVLDEARGLKVNHLFVLGDMVGYYYEATKVFDLLEKWPRHVIRGNHEDMLISLLDGKSDAENIRKKYGSGLSLALTTLSLVVIQQIRELPEALTVSLENLEIVLAHGAPWDTNQYIYPDAAPSLLERCDMKGIDFVFLGHTHYPLYVKGKHSQIVNPGSVGQSRVKGGVAEWGILDTVTGLYTAKQTFYDTTSIKSQAKEIDPDLSYLVSVLERK